MQPRAASVFHFAVRCGRKRSRLAWEGLMAGGAAYLRRRWRTHNSAGTVSRNAVPGSGMTYTSREVGVPLNTSASQLPDMPGTELV